MSLYYDSSVLVSLYVHEASSLAIARFLAKRAEAVSVNELHEIEMRSALRQKRFRKEIDDTQLAASLGLLKSDLEEDGRLVRAELDWQEVWTKAGQLSADITVRTGVRTLDLIHLAVALHQSASGLVSQDKLQCDAARAAGLKVMEIAN